MEMLFRTNDIQEEEVGIENAQALNADKRN